MPSPQPTRHRIPILLTSSVIAHDPGVALKDTDQRIELTIAGIREWLRIDPSQPIVVCDGSGFDFSQRAAREFPDTTIECIHFHNDTSQVQRYGRGYGEGEIVRYALDHSQLISEAGCFAKCTAKLWVSNFLQCIGDWNGHFLCKGVFLDVFSPFRPTRLAYVDTRFYVASLPYYRQHLLEAHRNVRKTSEHGLEECFLEVLQGHEMQHVMFKVAPVIYGIGGGIGRAYRNPLKRRLKETLRLWLVRRHPAFRTLFAEPTAVSSQQAT